MKLDDSAAKLNIAALKCEFLTDQLVALHEELRAPLSPASDHVPEEPLLRSTTVMDAARKLVEQAKHALMELCKAQMEACRTIPRHPFNI